MTTTIATPAIQMNRTGNSRVTRERAQEILHGKLLPGWKAQAGAVVENIMARSNALVDRVAKSTAMSWKTDGNTITLDVAGEAHTLHENAMQQAAALAEVPASYVTLLRHADPELLAHNLTKRFSTRVRDRQLVRSVGTQARAILSDKYRRIDSRPIMETLAKAAQSHGLVPMGGSATDLRFHMRLAIPEVYEVVDGEFVMFGLNWSNSDFGKGANDISDFFLRVTCNNGAVAESLLRQVHLGRRMEMSEGILSAETLALDTAAAVSACRDVIRTSLNKDRIQERVDVVRRAAAKELAPASVDAFLRKHLGKEAVKLARETYLSPDVEMLPQGQNVWRLSNTLSWLANAPDTDRETALDFQALAGRVLTGI